MDTEIEINGSSLKDYTSDSIRYYDGYWKKGLRISRTTEKRNEHILNLFFPESLEYRRILEIGVGGEGGLIRLLKDKNEVFGIDVSSSAQKNCSKLGLNIKIQNLDKTEISFENEFFDFVFAFEVFEHFAAPQFVIEEIRRVLNRRGIVLLSTPNPLIHHWPRLFYPEMFEEKSFREFLMINQFHLLERVCLGNNCYHERFADPQLKSWSWIWCCRKIDSGEPELFLEYGKYFWEQKNGSGIRTKTMEAVDLFRKSYNLDNQLLEAKFFLTRALIYRLINGEQEEFLENLRFIVNIASGNRYPQNMTALYHYAVIWIELKKLGLNIITEAQFNDALDRLGRLPESEKLLAAIQSESMFLKEE